MIIRMIELCENPTFPPTGTPEVDVAKPASAFETPELRGEGMASEIDSARAILARVAQITKERNIATAEQRRIDQLAAVEANKATISALVDLLAEVGYPGAKILRGVDRELQKSPGCNLEVGFEQLMPLALWPIGASVDEFTGQPDWCFGPDKKLYRSESMYVKRSNGTSSQCPSHYYMPVGQEDEHYLARVFEVQGALNAFDIPT